VLKTRTPDPSAPTGNNQKRLSIAFTPTTATGGAGGRSSTARHWFT